MGVFLNSSLPFNVPRGGPMPSACRKRRKLRSGLKTQGARNMCPSASQRTDPAVHCFRNQFNRSPFAFDLHPKARAEAIRDKQRESAACLHGGRGQ